MNTFIFQEDEEQMGQMTCLSKGSVMYPSGRRAMQTEYFLILREAMLCTVALHLKDAEPLRLF
jgi:hypothetical protein